MAEHIDREKDLHAMKIDVRAAVCRCPGISLPRMLRRWCAAGSVNTGPASHWGCGVSCTASRRISGYVRNLMTFAAEGTACWSKESEGREMKKLRICMEIQGLAQDENGAPCAGGVALTLGDDDAEEITGEEYRQMMECISIQGVLKAVMLDGIYEPEDCRLISPEEFDREYGEVQDNAQ